MPSNKKCSAGKVFRKSHMRSGKRVPGKCVKKGGKKSRSAKSVHKCSPRKVWRKSHMRSGKRVSGKCVKKSARK